MRTVRWLSALMVAVYVVLTAGVSWQGKRALLRMAWPWEKTKG